MASITSANSTFLLGILGIFAVPQPLQGYDVDDIFSAEPIDTAELKMGVDGILSAGWIPMAAKITAYLQADSASNGLFETWYTTEQASREKFAAFGVISIPSIGRSYTLANGFLSGYPLLPDAKKILQPRKYVMTFESCIPAPIA